MSTQSLSTLAKIIGLTRNFNEIVMIGAGSKSRNSLPSGNSWL